MSEWTWSDKGWQTNLIKSHRYAKETLQNCPKALPLVWMIQKSIKFFWSSAVLLSPRKAKSLSTQEDWFFIQHRQHRSTLCVQSIGWIKKKPSGRWRRFRWGLMYEKPGPNCPVVSFELYLSHLNPLNEFLFQRPKRNVSTSEDVWYDNMVVGERTLGEKIKKHVARSKTF